jgi:hypothetical protein
MYFFPDTQKLYGDNNGDPIDGYIWYEDGTWSERMGDDYSESDWWVHRKLPDIPAFLK